jgi:hypothetical protein
MKPALYYVKAYEGHIRATKNVKVICSKQPYRIAHAKFKKAVESLKYENVVIGEEGCEEWNKSLSKESFDECPSAGNYWDR